MWCIGKITPQYRHRMYNVLNLYEQSYNPDEPVVCVDEKSKQLLASSRPNLPLKPEQPTKVDYEYERLGTRNLFVAVEPLAGWRQVKVTRKRKKADFVQFIRQLLQGRYRNSFAGASGLRQSQYPWLPRYLLMFWGRNEPRNC